MIDIFLVVLYNKKLDDYNYVAYGKINGKDAFGDNVTYKFKTSEVKTTEEKKEIFNKKLLNIILQIENKDLFEA